ncbi:MAG: glycosyltransferase family 9 protein [Bacteroidota bacterium]
MTAVTPIAEKIESIHVVPWVDRTPPPKILAIRLQALGDTVITLPYLQSLHNLWPSTQFHFLTREEFGDLPRNMKMFDAVFTIGGGRDRMRQFWNALRLVPRLRNEKYDVVVDLQRNMVSRMIRRMVRPKSLSEFDRFSLNTAGDRTRRTINNLLPRPIPEPLPRLDLRENSRGVNALNAAGYHTSKKLIVLNPAGSFSTRSWPLDHFLGFATGWIDNVDADSQFLVLGTEQIREKANFLKKNLGDKLINLVGKTTPSEAFAILQKAELVVSEDSGLMHMAWVAQVPVVALFGSSRSAWSKPPGRWSVCLDSSDLDCGECLQPACRFGDVHCLSRYSTGFIVETARKLLEEKNQSGE